MKVDSEWQLDNLLVVISLLLYQLHSLLFSLCVELLRNNFFRAGDYLFDRILDFPVFDKICSGISVFPAIRSHYGVLSSERDISVIELVPFVVLERFNIGIIMATS